MFELNKLSVCLRLHATVTHPAAHILQKGFDTVKHQRLISQQVRVSIEYLVEEIAAVVGRQLGVPDQAVHLPDAHRAHRVTAVIDMEPCLKIDGILGKLVLDQENKLLFLQQFFEGQTLEMGAEGPPIRVVKVDMILPAHPLTLAHRVVQVLQLILGVHI